MDLVKETIEKKSKEILLNAKFGNSSLDNVIVYNIFYNDDSKLSYDTKFNDSFNISSFIKKLLYDIKFNNDIKLIKVFIINEKYKDIKDSIYCYVKEQIEINDQFMDNIEILREKINMYHLFSSSKFNKYDSFTDQDYSLVNSIIDIINSYESIDYGYIINHISSPKIKISNPKRRSFNVHQITSLYAINKENRNRLITGNVYRGYNFFNKQSKNYIVESYTQKEYLSNHHFLVNHLSLIKIFPYLANYILDLMNWKYVNNTDIIPEAIYGVMKQKYMNDKKVKVYSI